jgi:hypothetical protein
MAMPAPARVVVGIGITGLLLTVINQATAPSLEPPLERAAVLAGILSVLLMLIGVLGERVLPAAAERAALDGREGLELAAGVPPALARELGWGSTLLLTATPAAVVLILWGERPILRRGLLTDSPYQPGPIAERARRTGRAISLVDLRLYPGRAEFDALLPGLPSVLVQPFGSQGLLLLGGWSARCFSRSDLQWVEGWSRRLSEDWPAAMGADGSD